MLRAHRFAIALPLLAAVAACGSSPPPPRAELVPPQVSSTTVVFTSPPPPPSPPQELVPPPPQGGPATWEPGHWRFTGERNDQWAWVGGRYVATPADRTIWVVGQWQHQGNGWVWVEGHWQ